MFVLALSRSNALSYALFGLHAIWLAATFFGQQKKRDEKKEWSLKTRKTRETRNFVRFDCIWLHVCLGCSLLLFDCNWPRRLRRKLGWPKRNVAIIDVLSAATLQIANCRCRIADWRVISRGRRCKMEGIIFFGLIAVLISIRLSAVLNQYIIKRKCGELLMF